VSWVLQAMIRTAASDMSAPHFCAQLDQCCYAFVRGSFAHGSIRCAEINTVYNSPDIVAPATCISQLFPTTDVFNAPPTFEPSS
jgi:hypothetical protein